jgi:rare lipoprotein A
MNETWTTRGAYAGALLVLTVLAGCGTMSSGPGGGTGDRAAMNPAPPSPNPAPASAGRTTGQAADSGERAGSGKAERGEASWYGEAFEGKPTASGEPFDPDKLTAAHPDLPLGSKAKVTNLETGKSVTVEINDRGPYADGREIDVSKAAAQRLDMVEEGEAEVRIEPTR